MAELCGKFKLVSSENFDEFMKAMGVNIVMRKAGSLSKPVVELKQDGDTFILKTTTTFKTSEIKFKLGEEFEETRMDGSTCKTIITLEDGKLVQKQSGDKEVTIIRELEGDQMKTICKVDDIVSTRLYNRCE
ncbi:fatty acid-binding protein-like isoform X2 [Argiope bruennichi]|uniref:fatty acid-binding protein-like isoform X2 n=1 Tax=Argiope bruennichi TaxID=94029 RepID=UPI00249400C2|nr:fatty acid-binding protein-like isoform X2 [Argiope bruennichi]